jgi:photosystem II stability/assembly factor-like uncharacterized protein
MKKRLLLMLPILILYYNIYSQWEMKVDGLPDWEVADVLCVSQDSAILICANNTPLYQSIGLVNDWVKLNSPAPYTYSDAFVIDKEKSWFCTWDGKIIHSSNGGTDWVTQYEDANNSFFNFIKFFDKNEGIVVGDAIDKNSAAVILKTIDGGDNWISINEDDLIGVYSRDVFYPIEFPSKSVGYFCDYVTNNLFKTSDGGITWQVIVLPYEVGRINMIKFYNEKIGILVNLNFLGDNYLFRTLDGGESWKKLSFVTTRKLHDIEFLPSSPANVWLSNYDNLYFSSDTGKTWQQVQVTSGSLEAHNIEFLNDSIGFILCCNSKIFFTENNGGIVTSVETKKANVVSKYKLNQNYPNPFNPTTKISYQIPTSSNVKITIYDLLGNEVAEIINENKNAGYYEVDFEANNLSSGVYFYQIATGNFIQSKKMILLR